jgi:CHAD domain-containing protein
MTSQRSSPKADPARPPPDTSAHALLSPGLRALVADTRAAAARVAVLPRRSSAVDPEAIHDFRVAIRRLRTVLRPVRRVYGRQRLRLLGEDLKRMADATGELRDEEVLRETLGALPLAPATEVALGRWMEGRLRREHALRASIVRMLKPLPAGHPGPARVSSRATSKVDAEHLERTLVELDERFATSRKASLAIASLREEGLAAARADVRARASIDPSDAHAMHALRIRWKRLRYTAELFAAHDGTLGQAERAPIEHLAKRAARMQKRLGELHDLDEAIVRVKRAWGLEGSARVAVLDALLGARMAAAERAMTEVGDELSSWAAATSVP